MNALTHPCLVRSGWTGGTSAVEPATPPRSGRSLPWWCNVAIRLNKITVSDPEIRRRITISEIINFDRLQTVDSKRRDVRAV